MMSDAEAIVLFGLMGALVVVGFLKVLSLMFGWGP